MISGHSHRFSIAASMIWVFYALLIAVNLATGYALGRWWLRNRAAA